MNSSVFSCALLGLLIVIPVKLVQSVEAGNEQEQFSVNQGVRLKTINVLSNIRPPPVTCKFII